MKACTSTHHRRVRGLGSLAVLIILVLLAALAAAVVRMSWNSQAGVAQDVLSARAMHSANAGAEWGLYQAFKGSWSTCSNSSQTLDLKADTGFIVTVTCNSTLFNEGQDENGNVQTIRVYTISSVACNGSGACPDSSAVSGNFYVERERMVQATNR